MVRERNHKRIAYELAGKHYAVCAAGVAGLSVGGALIAPFLVTVLHLPVHSVAGAALAATFATSAAAVGAYLLVAPVAGVVAMPDWSLGILFGVGGLAGTYVGARMQRFVPAVAIKLLLAIVALVSAAGYLLG